MPERGDEPQFISPRCEVCEGAGWDWKRAADEDDLQVDDPRRLLLVRTVQGHGTSCLTPLTNRSSSAPTYRTCSTRSVTPVWSTAHPLPPAVLDAWTTYLASREMADGN